MFRLFKFIRPSIIQKNAFSALPNNQIIKKYLVDENLSQINAALACDEPPNYEVAITRGYALLEFKEKSAHVDALYAFDKALEFNPKSLSAYMGKLLIFNQLDLASRSQEVREQLEKNIPNYLELLSQIDNIKPRLPNLTPKTLLKNNLTVDNPPKDSDNTDEDIIRHQTNESFTVLNGP